MWTEPHVGDSLGEQTRRPTAVDLFRYSASTNNTHRIHYDTMYARSEGYPEVLVQGHLHGAYLMSLCLSWLGTRGRLSAIDIQVRRFAIAGDTLTCTGTVTAVRDVGDTQTVEAEIRETKSDGTECAKGTATFEFVKFTGRS